MAVGLGVERLGTSSVVYATAVFRADDTEAAAVGRFVHVYVDAVTRATVAVPDVIRAALRPLVDAGPPSVS